MISYNDALKMIFAAEPLGEAMTPIETALGCVLSQSVVSDVNIPPFDNSAMDGFAVLSEAIKGASDDNSVRLDIIGSTAAGDKPGAAGQGAWEIMTGAPVPEGYDAVVKIEDVKVEQGRVAFTSNATTGQNIRKAGQDFRRKETIVSAGQYITPYHVMALATIGRGHVFTRQKPRVSVFCTGKELIEDFDQPLQPGQIRNSNGPLIKTALKQEGYEAFYGGTIEDDRDVFADKVTERLPHSDVIISTGAVSAGKYDFIPDTIRILGADVMFHRVAIQPGKPIFYARFKTGQHFFGLPGNPISSAIGLRFFILPLLRHLQNMAVEQPLFARLKEKVHGKPGMRLFRKAQMEISEDGACGVKILDGQESFKVHPMLRANCWAVISEEAESLDKGTVLPVVPLFTGEFNIEPNLEMG